MLHDLMEFGGGLQATARKNVVISKKYTTGRKFAPVFFAPVFDENGFIPEAHRTSMSRQVYIPIDDIEVEDHYDRPVIYGDHVTAGYGHFITESLARLWYAKLHPECPIVWTSGMSFNAMHKAIIDLIGIKNEMIFLSKPTKFSEVIFPFPGLSIGDYFLPGHAEFIGCIDQSPIVSGKKLYITRSELLADRGRGEQDQEMTALLERYGFQAFAPEKHDIRTQLNEISSSSVIVGVEGSALHTPIFLRGRLNAPFIAIARHRMGRGIFSHIENRKFDNYKTIDIRADKNRRMGNTDPLEISIPDLTRALEATAGFEDISAIPSDLLVQGGTPETTHHEILKKFSMSPSDIERRIFRVRKEIDAKNFERAVLALADLLI